MDFMQEYEKWLHSPALSPEEHAELESIKDDPKEIESLIDDLPGVVESAVIGLAHPDLGEGVTAIVVPQKGANLDEAGVIAALGDRLARYKQPKRVIFVEELPRNVMGKVQKAELRKRHADLYR